jgi:hypothetical protein
VWLDIWLYRSDKKPHNRVLCGHKLEEDATINNFSDFLYSYLIEFDHNTTTSVHHLVVDTDSLLERIEKDGEVNLPVVAENKARGKMTGQAIQIKCFVCH